MNFRNLFLAFLLVTLGACSQETPAPEPANDAAATELAQDAAEEAVAPSVEAVEQAAIETVTESDSIEEEAEAEEIVLTDVETVTETPTAPTWKYEEGKHYNRLTTAQGTSSPPDKIEVAEVFWYGCPHCYNFEPYIERWRDNLPSDVSFVRIPVIWNPTNQIHARAFYTAQALDVTDEFHLAMFRAIHKDNEPMTSEGAIQDLFEGLGVDEEIFDQTFESFAVNGNIKRAGNFTQRYQIRSVPLLVINGKYKTDAPAVTSFEDMLSVADELIERERQDK